MKKILRALGTRYFLVCAKSPPIPHHLITSSSPPVHHYLHEMHKTKLLRLRTKNRVSINVSPGIHKGVPLVRVGFLKGRPRASPLSAPLVPFVAKRKEQPIQTSTNQNQVILFCQKQLYLLIFFFKYGIILEYV